MKVLSIRQPYASLIQEGIKKYEIRSRKINYRGKLYIHSSLAKITKKSRKNDFLYLLDNASLKYGHILFECDLVDCVLIDEEFLKEMNVGAPKGLYNDDCIGYYAWVIGEIKVLKEGIPAKGQLGIWNYNK